ncbi:MAG TPA: FAD-binding and (Fe-S)-binding domain-containing protein [Bacteroidales bacterium]|nr:FAD-binding and (Fe-S)-binding domain-containing protein [Bacteroidales bacterium]
MKTRYAQIAHELKKSGYASPVFTDPLYTLAKGTDAGLYRLIPKLVVQVNNEQEVLRVLELCRQARVAVTFKAGGTSLCGQTISDSVLIETGPSFNKYTIGHKGSEISLHPGITGGLANTVLNRFHKKIGPSPASIASAKIGGIIANNASGASYGIATNSYNTLKGLRIVMADGSILDSRDVISRNQFAAAHPEILNGLKRLSEKVKFNEKLHSFIRHKYVLKNTTGYGLNSLIDFDDPLDMLWHLAIGSEGTLGFISEATFNTVESHPFSAAALVFLPDIREACRAIIPLRNCEVSAAELMDRNALRSVTLSGVKGIISELPETAVALLIDTSAPDKDILKEQATQITGVLKGIRTLYPVEFIYDPVEYSRIWKVRKGLFTSAAATRPPGTACLIEDVAFSAEVLGDAVVTLRQLISDFNYAGSVMWGHLLDGNVHFVIMPDFRKPDEVEKYRQFMEKLADLVVNDFDGSLKAEHGTGRNMAPFVEKEWGPGLYGVMKNIKKILDPSNMLNPGVILNYDPAIHIKNIKLFPVVHETIDQCIECGFCENDCPSKNLTLTPRQRIVAYREISSGHPLNSRLMAKAFKYNGEQTCATDGLCGLACPVEINTGKLIKDLRFNSHGALANFTADTVSKHIAFASSLVRSALNAAALFHIPLLKGLMPHGRHKISHKSKESELKVVYFPTCINRSMGKSSDYGRDQLALVEKTINLLEKAGYEVILPAGLDNLCCGMAFESKGFFSQAKKKADELEKALLEASRGGQIPVYCDMSPCLFHMKETLSPKLKMYEPVQFILEFLVPRLTFSKLSKRVAIHSTCSTIKMGIGPELVKLASMCCIEGVVPDDIGCCGWAGDRGFTKPELNKSALSTLRIKIPEDIKEGYSTSRTCEIGLSLHSGITYKSIVYLVDEATTPLY